MTRARELIRTIGLYLWLGGQLCLTRVKQNPVPIAVVGVLVLAVIQITTGTAMVGRSTQKAIENVCELLLLVGLGESVHRDFEQQGKR